MVSPEVAAVGDELRSVSICNEFVRQTARRALSYDIHALWVLWMHPLHFQCHIYCLSEWKVTVSTWSDASIPCQRQSPPPFF